MSEIVGGIVASVGTPIWCFLSFLLGGGCGLLLGRHISQWDT